MTEEVLKKVSLYTLGCRLNISETGQMTENFLKKGYRIVPFGEMADVVYLNTCTVTDKADSTCRNIIRKAVKTSPDAQIIVVGCYAQMAYDKIAAIEGVDLILGTSEKFKVFDYLEEREAALIRVDQTNEFWGASTTSAEDRTRAFLKIQDGCNYRCSYCIIPQARGRSKALSVNQAIETAKKITLDGLQEIILTGVNIGEYESSSGEKLSTLLKHLFEISNLKRLRLSSVEPNTIKNDLLEILKNSPKFMGHFHIPLQSGDDEILKRMRRKYSIKDYRKVIDKICKIFPNIGLGTDIICGYPGESDEQFERTFSLLEELPLTHFHIFPFSKRQNTLASREKEQLPDSIKKQRVKRITALGNKKLEFFKRSQIGLAADVLFEQKKEDNFYTGYTENYLKVYLDSKRDMRGSIQNVQIGEFRDHRLIARQI